MRRCVGAYKKASFIHISLSGGIYEVVKGAIMGSYCEGTVEDIDSGDTTWVLVATTLVLFMTPGLAFHYGGAVDHKVYD